MSDSELPPLPKIEGDVDLILDVFTHKSIRFGGVPPNEEYGTTERLAELGRVAFDLAITHVLYLKRPQLSAEKIVESRETFCSDTTLERWIEAYQLRLKLRYAPDVNVTGPEETRHLFHSYVGALYIRNGMPCLHQWIGQLVDPQAVPLQGAMNSSTVQGSQGWNSPAPPSSPPPPLPRTPGFSQQQTSAPAGVPLVSLALLNQTATQRGISVTYQAEPTGPSHQPTWTVRCCMNGVEKGRGSGKSQKIAKEEAARQAWVSMGW